ncbi:hypothetical protein [Micromonospora psammae]|uniref:hypothetical protein n=1 Tax=Micromonospora sp. CPCC 205556 TaxID=3122398 RepID=UPI002FEFC3E5
MEAGEAAHPVADERLATLRRWWRLPAPVRREVVTLSRARRHHPDDEVAWVAWRWAQVVLPPGAPEPGRARNVASAFGFWIALLVGLLGDDPTDPPAPHWLDRRRARRLLRVGPPVR